MVLSRRAQVLGLSPETWEPLKAIPDLPEMVPMMRNLLHVAAAFSPLIVLLPKKPGVEGIHRDHLLAVRFWFLVLSTQLTLNPL